ncbi:hypothetical protein [Calothrix sp. 336/3]|uniref:hypothetical protein n=1 Tax=Calothrix sp. 336/3 TaxID=1337936 RepID=UPI0004E2FDD4|nr:hypothetical protein [Calothrix sp. 336/3]AKG20145.1 hypothetical protein IJ00_01430 [Calothrix sp. 336/3]
MSKKFHIAISVTDLEAAIADYSQRLGHQPCIIVPNEYALWRTETLNFSIRFSYDTEKLRHLGWEDDTASTFSEDIDVNGIAWERFTAAQQQQEVEALWSGNIVRQNNHT